MTTLTTNAHVDIDESAQHQQQHQREGEGYTETKPPMDYNLTLSSTLSSSHRDDEQQSDLSNERQAFVEAIRMVLHDLITQRRFTREQARNVLVQHIAIKVRALNTTTNTTNDDDDGKGQQRRRNSQQQLLSENGPSVNDINHEDDVDSSNTLDSSSLLDMNKVAEVMRQYRTSQSQAEAMVLFATIFQLYQKQQQQQHHHHRQVKDSSSTASNETLAMITALDDLTEMLRPELVMETLSTSLTSDRRKPKGDGQSFWLPNYRRRNNNNNSNTPFHSSRRPVGGALGGVATYAKITKDAHLDDHTTEDLTDQRRRDALMTPTSKTTTATVAKATRDKSAVSTTPKSKGMEMVVAAPSSAMTTPAPVSSTKPPASNSTKKPRLMGHAARNATPKPSAALSTNGSAAPEDRIDSPSSPSQHSTLSDKLSSAENSNVSTTSHGSHRSVSKAQPTTTDGTTASSLAASSATTATPVSSSHKRLRSSGGGSPSLSCHDDDNYANTGDEGAKVGGKERDRGGGSGLRNSSSSSKRRRTNG